MANWDTQLPEAAIAGGETHIEDHNTIVTAIEEARAALDTLEAALGGKATTDHKHAAGDVTSGTLDVARIPALAINKITGLQGELDGKQAQGDYATAAQVDAKANQADLDALESRVAALEPEA